MFKNIQYLYLLNKYIKCNAKRLAVRYDSYRVVRRQRVNVSGMRALSICKTNDVSEDIFAPIFSFEAV